MALDRLTKIDGGGISTTSDYRVGIITATKFVGPIEGDLTGSITATDGTFTGNVSIAGTLTYEDVTNVDSVGIITAQKGIHVGAGVSAVGVGTFGSLDISGDIDVDGHTNLDNVSIAGVTTTQAFNATTGNFVKTSNNYVLVGSSNAGGASLVLDGDSNGDGSGTDYAYIEHDSSGNLNIVGDNPANAANIIFKTNSSTERIRIGSDGRILIGHDVASADLHGPQHTTNRNPYVQLHGANCVNAGAALISWKNSAGAYYAPTLYLAHSGSDTIGTNGILPTNGEFGSIVFSGDDGTDFVKGAMIKARLDGTPGTDDMPGRLEFHTTPDGAQVPVERLRITSSGDVGINVTPISGVTLQVGTPNSATGVMRGHPDYFSIDSGSAAGGGVVGTASNPALIFGGDGNTGLYHSASDTLNFTTGGTERLRIDSNGDVLINRNTSIDVASTATSKLQVHHGSGNISAAFYSTANHIGPSGVLALGHARGSDSGILQDNDVMGQIRFAGGDGNDLESQGALISAEVDGTPGVNDMPGRLVFSTTVDGASSATEKLRITSGGTVGINNSSPNSYFKLDVNGHTNIVGDVALPTTNRIYWGNSDTAFIKGEHGGSAYLAFGANNEKMRLTRAGNLGIGTDDPNVSLEILNDSPGLRLTDNNSSAGSLSYTQLTNINGNTYVYTRANSNNGNYLIGGHGGGTFDEFIRIDPSGRVIVGGGTSPTAALSVAVVGSYGGSSTNTPFVYLCRDEAATAISGGESLGQILFASNDGYRGAIIEASANGTWSGSSSDGYLKFKTTPDNTTVPVERLRITSAGLVDIFGSASQSTYTPLLLQNSAAAGTGSNPDIVKLAFGSSGFTKASIRAAVYGEGFMTFHTNNDTEKLRITSDGKVGINDNNPANQLVVKHPGGSGHTVLAVISGDASTKMTMQTVQGSEGRFGMSTNHPLAIYTNGNERLRITSDGVATFTNSSPPATGVSVLHVSNGGSATTLGTAATLRVSNNGGNGAYSVFEAESSTGSIRLANDGQFYVTGASTFSNDIRIDTGTTADGIVGAAYGTGYFGIKQADQGSSEYMMINANSNTYISCTSGYSIYVRPSANSSVHETIFAHDNTTFKTNVVLDGHQLRRNQHHSGHMEGGYNNIGASTTKTSPIYTIGSNYNPNEDSLNDMYGIGYTHRNASFIDNNIPTDQSWGLYVASDGDARIFLSGTGGSIWPTGVLGRVSHHKGHMQGGYNNIGNSAAKTSPIYTIGSSYNPNETTLSNMYGIGYSNGDNASFLPAGGWGMYVASDGDARIFLDAQHGYLKFNGGSGAIHFTNGSWSGEKSEGKIQTHGNHMYFQTAGAQWFFRKNDGSTAASIANNGTYTGSDLTLKKDVVTISNSVDTIKKLTGRSFTWKEDDKKSFGVIAQEVETVLPELVTTSEEPEGSEVEAKKMVNYAAFAGHFIEAIKELSAKIETLEQENTALKARVTTLEG